VVAEQLYVLDFLTILEYNIGLTIESEKNKKYSKKGEKK
jgi:hypothetical protein